MQSIIRNGVAWLALAGAALVAQADTVARAIGGTSIQVPVPPGYVEVTDPRLLDFARKTTPNGNRLLAVFVSQADDERMRAGFGPLMQRYFMLQTSRRAEAAKLNPSDFAQVKAAIRAQMPTTSERVLPGVNKDLRNNLQDEAVQAEVKSVAGDGVFLDTDTAIGFGMRGEVKVTAAERSETTEMGSAGVTALARGKLVFFYAYAIASDLDWARGEARSWAAQLERANR
ncbi:MAG TPA: hypothetical protein VF522_22740 [Ramlibacter sp.]|uniref:hypothetical protein n=1 Tax=Ramlibacter sp. TaxID=1917967 RepID=UPI002ED46F7B